MPPLKPHFYIVKMGFTGVYIIFLILLKKHRCGYSLELLMGITGVHIIFLILLKKHRLWVLIRTANGDYRGTHYFSYFAKKT